MASWLNRGFWDENQSQNGHAINRTGQLAEGALPHTVCAPYYMAAFIKDLPDGMESVKDSEVRIQKIVRDGQLVIIRGDKEYTADGRLRISD